MIPGGTIMKFLTLILCLFVFTVTASADVSNLAGGVLIAHHPTDVYSAGQDWCARYADFYAIDDAADQNPRSDLLSDNVNKDIWFVVAAFVEDKVWCGTQFGLGDYDALAWYMTGSGNCLANSLEIPTAGWPGPLSGISIAATDVQYVGNFLPIVWFEGYTYSGDPTVIPITVDPSQDFIGFGNCEAPAGVWAAEGGAMGFFTDGVHVYPIPPPPVEACCDEFGVCTMVTEEECTQSGGIVQPGEDCDTYICTGIVRICCFEDGSCVVMLPDFCDINGGVVYDDEVNCDPNPCPPPMGRCCYEDGSCVVTIEIDCDGILWEMFGICDPNTCQHTAIDEPSWGEIKSLYK
jgi:hypothetical protein